MNENPDETPEDFRFRKLSSNDILKERVNGSNGYPELAIPNAGPAAPICATCKDTLWVATKPSKPDMKPVLVPCSCQQGKDEKTNRLTTYADLGNLSDRTFKTLKPRWRRGNADPDSLEQGVKAAKEFAKKPEGWLVISGPLRTGKSHIAAAITNQCTSRGTPTKFVSAMYIDETVRDLDRWSEAEDAQAKWEAVINAPVLIIDDFGMHLSNARVAERLDQLLTVRAAGPLPTVIVLAKRYNELPDRLGLRLIDEHLCTRLEILPRGHTDTVAGRVPSRLLEQMTFRTFDPNGDPRASRNDRHALSLALDAAMGFASDPARWIYFHGPTGVGKTHLAVAIARHAQANGITPTYWRLPELLDRLRDSYSDRSPETLDDRLGAVKNAELLILDDFCPPKMTDWTLEKLYQLVCHRYDLLLPTVTAGPYVFWEDHDSDERTQRLVKHLQQQHAEYSELSDRLLWDMIMSRMHDRTVVSSVMMSAPDYRDRGA